MISTGSFVTHTYDGSHPEVKKLNAVVIQWPDQSGKPVVSIQSDSEDAGFRKFLRVKAMELIRLYGL